MLSLDCRSHNFRLALLELLVIRNPGILPLEGFVFVSPSYCEERVIKPLTGKISLVLMTADWCHAHANLQYFVSEKETLPLWCS